MSYKYLSNAAHGYKAHDDLEEQLRRCLSDGLLSAVIKEFRVGDENYGNDEQFYAPFMVQFCDRQRWLIYSTTSCRTDRIKGQQWDAENLKRLDASIEAAYLVYPDVIDKRDIPLFKAQREKYSSGYELSYIDDICCVTDIIEAIKNRAEEIYRKHALPEAIESSTLEERYDEIKSQQKGISKLPNDEIGKIWDFQGRSFERQLASIINSAEYFAAWKARTSLPNRAFSYYERVLQCFGIAPERTHSITATSEQSDIGLLPNGGQPKTDVLVKVTDVLGKEKAYTISCKRTNSDWVTAHQYKASDFLQVLDPQNEELGSMLHAFQYAGSIRAMGAASSIALSDLIGPYAEKLSRWVLGGDGGLGNPNTQHARYLATYKPSSNTFSVHSVDDYVARLMSLPKQNFSTPFRWTYASGQRRKSIQLKMPIL